jgi:hypothetical protein
MEGPPNREIRRLVILVVRFGGITGDGMFASESLKVGHGAISDFPDPRE